MSIFDLLFLALFLVTVLCLMATGWFAVRRNFARSRRILVKLAAGAGVYMTVVILVSVVAPRRVLNAGEAECFDDWCIGVASYEKRLTGTGAAVYEVKLRLSSRARRVSQRENNVSVYLTGSAGGRYDPVADRSAAPLNTLLHPGESVVVRRRFLVPSAARVIGLVVRHEGGFPIGWFIIGYPAWFRQPTVIPLPD